MVDCTTWFCAAFTEFVCRFAILTNDRCLHYMCTWDVRYASISEQYVYRIFVCRRVMRINTCSAYFFWKTQFRIFDTNLNRSTVAFEIVCRILKPFCGVGCVFFGFSVI